MHESCVGSICILLIMTFSNLNYTVVQVYIYMLVYYHTYYIILYSMYQAVVRRLCKIATVTCDYMHTCICSL